MPRFVAKLTSFEFDIEVASRTFEIAINKLYREAAKRFLEAALPRVPFRTGFARGAFYRLEKFAGEGGPAAAARRTAEEVATGKKKGVSPAIFHPHFFTRGEAFDYRRKLQFNIFAGKREKLNPSGHLEYYNHTDRSKTIKSQTSGQNFASLDFNKEGGKYVFDFRVDITYFGINDENSNPRYTLSAPWKSFASGKKVFYDYIKSSLDTLPHVTSFLFETTYTLNKEGTITRQRTKRTV